MSKTPQHFRSSETQATSDGWRGCLSPACPGSRHVQDSGMYRTAATLRASLSGTLLQTARFSYATEGALFISAQLSSDAVSTLRKVQVLYDCGSSLAPKHARKHETHPPLVRKRVPSRLKRLRFYLRWCKLCWWLYMIALFYSSCL